MTDRVETNNKMPKASEQNLWVIDTDGSIHLRCDDLDRIHLRKCGLDRLSPFAVGGIA
jgi:hypothetical protein